MGALEGVEPLKRAAPQMEESPVDSRDSSISTDGWVCASSQLNTAALFDTVVPAPDDWRWLVELVCSQTAVSDLVGPANSVLVILLSVELPATPTRFGTSQDPVDEVRFDAVVGRQQMTEKKESDGSHWRISDASPDDGRVVEVGASVVVDSRVSSVLLHMD